MKSLPTELHIDFKAEISSVLRMNPSKETIKHADENLILLPKSLKYILVEKPWDQALMTAFTGLPISVNALYRTKRNSSAIYLTSEGKKWKKLVRQFFENSVLEQGWHMPETRQFLKMYIYYETGGWTFPDPNNMFKLLLDAAEGVVFKNDKFVLTDIVRVEPETPEPRTFILTLS
jgi:Holliday junction resolvase RusA-like endonuclease